MSEFRVFYSWQSDLANAINRGFIGDALEKACKAVAANPEIEEAPRVDQDTKDLAGSPLIPQAIMDKIDSCQAFVADVSLCFSGPQGKLGPNPNVVYELGYAVARLGWDRIVLVVNEEFGKVEQLPFDLEKRRAVPYAAKEGETDRSEAKKALVGRLVACIEAIANMQPIVTRVTPTEAARDAVASQTPNRLIRVREFQRWLFSTIDSADPGVVEPTAFVDSLQGSRAVMEAFSTVVEAAAIVDDPSSIRELWRGFEKVLERYDVPPRYSGPVDERQHDWWRFHGYEMCIIVTAQLLRERKLSLLGELLREGFVQRRWAESRNSSQADYRDLSAYVRSIYNWNQQLKAKGETSWISPHGELLKERYAAPSELLPDWTQFCEADLVLALFGASEQLPSNYERWLNQTHIYLAETPRFILEARSATNAHQLKDLFGAVGFPQLKEWLGKHWDEMDKVWKEYHRRYRKPNEAIEAIASA